MSFLAPLYALAGLAIALPIVFHLIRKRPKERKLMSSLMFLDPTPPRLTRQSSVDQWLLLLMRATVIALLALAFTRPYWNAPAEKDADRKGMHRMLLIDTSASMRREGLWSAAVQRAEQVIRQSGPLDALAVYQFDRSLRPMVPIDSALQTPPSQRQQQAIAALRGVSPTWMPTNLGLALITAADLLQTDWDSSADSNATASEIVVVTDFQNGAEVERLAEYAWPAACKVRIERIDAALKGNARACLLPADETMASSFETSSKDEKDSDAIESEKLRIRVTSSAASGDESLNLRWLDEELRPIESSRITCRIPSGSSMTVRMPVPPKSSLALQLGGDASDFDNRFYISRSEPIALTLLCVEAASKASDETLGYFLRQLPLSDAARTVTFQAREPASLDSWPVAARTPLIVASHALSMSDFDGLAAYLDLGGHLLWVWDKPPAAQSTDSSAERHEYAVGLQKLCGITECKVVEAKVRQYAMLESIDFKHPLFADLSDSKFNDFSKIRFWKHRTLETQLLPSWNVLAKFDDGAPALVCKRQGNGMVWILMAGWQPKESQLALSTKFVPLISGLFRLATPSPPSQSSYRVGMTQQFTREIRVFDPKGSIVESTGVDENNKSIMFAEPGIYRWSNLDGMEGRIAVNLDESESYTSVGGLERLEKLGVVMTNREPTDKEASRRQLRAVELESQQGWWRWLIIGVMGVIGLESLLCIRKAG